MSILNLHSPVLAPNGVGFYSATIGASGVSLVDKTSLEQLPDNKFLPACCWHVSAG